MMSYRRCFINGPSVILTVNQLNPGYFKEHKHDFLHTSNQVLAQYHQPPH